MPPWLPAPSEILPEFFSPKSAHVDVSPVRGGREIPLRRRRAEMSPPEAARLGSSPTQNGSQLTTSTQAPPLPLIGRARRLSRISCSRD